MCCGMFIDGDRNTFLKQDVGVLFACKNSTSFTTRQGQALIVSQKE